MPNGAVASRVRSSLLSASRSSFVTLNSGLWLTDKIINYVARSIIQPGIPRMHCYITYFFQLLLGPEIIPTLYNYTAVNDWSTNIDGASSVFDLCELYIPINKGRVHWLHSGNK